MLSRLDADKRLAQPDQEERVDEDKDADDDQADGDNDHVDVDVWRWRQKAAPSVVRRTQSLLTDTDVPWRVTMAGPVDQTTLGRLDARAAHQTCSVQCRAVGDRLGLYAVLIKAHLRYSVAKHSCNF